MVFKLRGIISYCSLIILGGCCTTVTCAQEQRIIDSLTHLIKNDRSESDFEVFYDLTFQYATKNNDLALKYLNKAMEISDVLGDSLRIVKTRRVKGQILRRMGRIPESLKSFSEALPIAQRNRYDRENGFIYREVGFSHLYFGNFDTSLSSFFSALEVWESMNDEVSLAEDLTNIGFLHYRVGNYEKSIEYSTRALLLKMENKVTKTATTQINIGLAHCAQSNFDAGLKFVDEGLASCSPDCSDQIKMQAGFGHGVVAVGLHDPLQAQKKFMQSYEYACKLSDTRFQADCLLWLGRSLLDQNKLDSALHCLRRTVMLSTKHGYRQMLMNAYFFMANVYKHAGDQDLSRQYVERYSILRDSLHSFEVRSKVLVAELEFERQQNQLEIQHKEELIRQKNAEYVLIVIVCLLLILIALGLVWLLRNKAKLNARLDEKIRERTRDLESHRAALERSFSEQSEMILKTSSSIKSALATHKGLRDTLAKEGISGERENFENIEDHLNKWAEELSKIQRTKTGI
jgi:tetratricopeptide (TPR) repeat protein